MVYRILERLSPAITGLVLALFAAAHLTVGPVRTLSILVAGCPSAFIIASSFQSGYQIARLARHGILVRGGRSLEASLLRKPNPAPTTVSPGGGPNKRVGSCGGELLVGPGEAVD